MKNSNKNKHPKEQGEGSSDLSLEEEIIKALEKKNEQIKSGRQQQDQGVSKGKTSGGFDEWSVSWP